MCVYNVYIYIYIYINIYAASELYKSYTPFTLKDTQNASQNPCRGNSGHAFVIFFILTPLSSHTELRLSWFEGLSNQSTKFWIKNSTPQKTYHATQVAVCLRTNLIVGRRTPRSRHMTSDVAEAAESGARATRHRMRKTEAQADQHSTPGQGPCRKQLHQHQQWNNNWH